MAGVIVANPSINFESEYHQDRKWELFTKHARTQPHVNNDVLKDLLWEETSDHSTSVTDTKYHVAKSRLHSYTRAPYDGTLAALRNTPRSFIPGRYHENCTSIAEPLSLLHFRNFVVANSKIDLTEFNIGAIGKGKRIKPRQRWDADFCTAHSNIRLEIAEHFCH